MIKFWKKSLLIQIVGSFSLLSLVIVALVGYLAFVQAKETLKRSVFDRLGLAASLKEEELNRWLRDRRNTLLSLSNLLEVRAEATILLTSDPATSEYQAALTHLQTSLEGFIRDRADYREIFLISRGGKILVSSDREEIGKYEPNLHSSEALADYRDLAATNFYRTSETNLPAVTFSTPILDENGTHLGLLAVHLNLDRLDEIIRDDRQIDQTGETYLVTDLGGNTFDRYSFLSAEAFGSQEFPDGIESAAITAAIAGNNGRGLYRNYRGIPAIGIYRWLENQDVALLVEMEQQEAFAPARRLANSIVFVGLGLSGILAGGMLLLGRQIVRPILTIARVAQSVGVMVKQGNFTDLQTVNVASENEIGILAKTFNQMTEGLQDSYQALQAYSKTLKP